MTIVQSGDRLMPTDHPGTPRSSSRPFGRTASTFDWVSVRPPRGPGGGASGAHAIDLSDGSTAEGHAILLAVGREFPIDDLELECYGVDTTGGRPFPREAGLRSRTALGDRRPGGARAAHPPGHYQGELAVRMALGDDVVPDYRALVRASYTDPEAAFAGVSPEQARADGVDAVEFVADFATSARGYSVMAKRGHVTVIFDRASRTMIGAAMACPDASAAIHECVLAIRARVPVEVLADTIHAFPRPRGSSTASSPKHPAPLGTSRSGR